MDFVIDTFDQVLCHVNEDQSFPWIDEVLAKCPEELPLPVLVSFLVSTLAARDRLRERPAFAKRVRARCAALESEDADAIMRGLE